MNFDPFNHLCTEKKMILMEDTLTTLEELYLTNCSNVPEEKGIYFILRPKQMKISFTLEAVNRSAPAYPADLLEDKYSRCVEQDILYIGKANGKEGLRQRLRQYTKYGWNEASNHKGGRAIWQIEDCHRLLVSYQVCNQCEKKEHDLLQTYKEKNGAYPLANWRG